MFDRMPRKIMKVVKKLKFWSRKKKRSSTRFVLESQTYYVPTPICRRCSVEPSAPPLPSWLELEEEEQQTHYDFPTQNSQSHYQYYYYYNNSNHSYCNASELDPAPKPFMGVGTTDSKQDGAADFVDITHNQGPGADGGVAHSKQQHVDPIPGSGFGNTEIVDDDGDGFGLGRREGSGSGGLFGCIVHIMGCFCPCLSFRDREITHNPYHRLSISHSQKEHHT